MQFKHFRSHQSLQSLLHFSFVADCLFKCWLARIQFIKINDPMNREQEGMLDSFQQFYDELGYNQASLKWSSNPHQLLISGSSDFTSLRKLKNVILSLRKDWGADTSKGIRVEGGIDYEKRLQLAQSQIDGLLKRKINFSVKDSNGGQRVLDYSNLLNQKQNQLVELQKKIQNLEQKLKRTSQRESELEEHVVRLTAQLKRKEDIIALKHETAVAEVAISTMFRDAINRIKRNLELNRYKLGDSEKLIMDGVTLADIGNFDIKSDVFSDGSLTMRSRVYQQQTETQKYKTRLVQFFREFERLSNQSQGITDFEVERILEGFLINMPETKLYAKMQFSILQYQQNQELKRLRQNFSIAAGLFSDMVAKLRRDNHSIVLPLQVENFFILLQQQKVTAVQVVSGAIFVNLESGAKVIEIPVQDARTKHLVHVLASQLKKMFLKYPKLQGEIDERLGEFLKQEIIDVIQADQIEKLIQIVKYVPHIVRVDNVYAHSTEKDRKIQFHLRVLLKALLEQLQKVKIKTGITLQIDEGVVGMIKAQIMNTVNVDDILKVFRTTPKIVQVQKIVQKIVDRIVEVPKVITIQKIVEKIVEVQKIKQVEKIVHVPIETPLIVQTEIEKLVPYESKIQTIVQVPTIVEKIVELHKQVPKIHEIQVFRDKIVEVDRPIEVERVVNHIQIEYQQVELIQEKIVPVEKIIEKIIEVPVFVEKIVQRVVQIPKIIEVEKIIEKIVPVIEYRSAREVQNHIEVKYQIVDRIVEKIVPIIQIRERIVEVPQQIQVIKQVNNIITEIKEVQVIHQKIVIQEVIKEVVRVEKQIVEVIREVVKEVEKYIQIPIIKEILVVKELIIEKPIISRIQSVHIQEVIIKQPYIVREPKIVQVEKFVNVYIEVPKIIKQIQERIVEVPTIVDRIKQVPVFIEKIIQKMVEVPKVVQVEKIVEKVVVVPRVIEKVVEVPQFVQKIIQKQVIREVIRQVEKLVHVPVIQQRIKQIQVIKNIYIEVQKPVETIVQRIVQVPKVEQKIITKEILREIPINIIQQVPRTITVEKIVTQNVEVSLPVPVEKQIIVPFEIPVPVDRVVEKIIPRQQIIERIIPVPQIMEKIVQVVHEVVEIRQIERIVERILIEKSIVEIEKIVPYFQEIIKEVPTIIEKFIPIETKVEQIVTAQQIIEKVIQKTITIPQIYQIQRVKEKLIEVPKLIQIQRMIPQIIRVNQYIQKIAQKIVEIPIIIETMKQVVRQQQRIVPIKSQTTEIVEVERIVEKLVYAQKLKEVVRNVNYIEKVLQIIDRIEQIPVSVCTVEERFIEVPYILEKIVEKIVVMPQIVEVLKYVHEVCETQTAGVCVGVEFGTHELRYKQLCKTIQGHLDSVLKQLRYLKSDQVTRARIETIQKFLEELRKFILVPRIVKVVEEKIVQKDVPVDRIVQIPIQDEKSLRMQLSLGILVQKLIMELKRIKQKTGVEVQLDQDIRLIFFNQLSSSPNLDQQMQGKLKSYSAYIQRQFENLGSWSSDHQFMLNSFLQQRFLMAEMIQSANFQLQQAKLISQQRIQGLKKYKGDTQHLQAFLNKISSIIIENKPVGEIVQIVEEYERFKSGLHPQPETLVHLPDLDVDNERFSSLLRQKDAEITMLRDTLIQIQQKTQQRPSIEFQGVIRVLKAEVEGLRKENSVLLSRTTQSGITESYRQQIKELQARNLELEGQISRLKSDNYNISNELKLAMHSVSFKRQPDSTFQYIDLKDNEAKSKLYQSQSSQGLSLSGSQAQTQRDAPNITNSILVPSKTGGFTSDFKSNTGQQAEQSLTQSGLRNVQTPQQITNFDQVQLAKSGIYTTQAGQPRNQSSLFESQRRQPGSSKIQGVSQFGGNLYQSGVQKYQGQGLSSSIYAPQPQSEIKNFGVEESQYRPSQSGARQTQSQAGLQQSQIGSIKPSTQYQSYQQPSALYQSQQAPGLQQSQSGLQQSQASMQSQSGLQQSQTSLQPQGGIEQYQGSQQYQSGGQQYQQGLSQSQYNSGLLTRSGAQIYQSTGSLQGSNLIQSSVQPGTRQLQGSQAYPPLPRQGDLTSSRQQSSRITPATQPLSYDPIGRNIQSGTVNLYGSQAQQPVSQQSSIVSTPIETLKYRSPSPRSGKLAESVVKEEESLSKVSAQSPQVFKKEETGQGQGQGQGQGSEYRYYFKPDKK